MFDARNLILARPKLIILIKKKQKFQITNYEQNEKIDDFRLKNFHFPHM